MPIVKLPRKRLIAMDRDTITIDLPEEKKKRKKKIDYELIKKAKGILAHKKDELLKYAKDVRTEWD